jgi:thiamine biosynthesis lipoprotein
MRTAADHVMGTVVSAAAPDSADPDVFAAATAAAFAYLRHIDEVFSPYKPDSPVSRLRDGRLAFDALRDHPDGDEIREVLALCALLRDQSAGAFDAFKVGDPPQFDPSGAVKGWAAEHASRILAEHGLPQHALSAGGDVRLRGGTGDQDDDGNHGGGVQPWRVGIADPHRPGNVLTVVYRADGAVATSGTAERGAHVTHPPTGRPATALASVTVTGPDLALADGYATAALALAADDRPQAAYAWLTDLAARTGYQALTVDRATGVWWTDGMPHLIPALAAHQPPPGYRGPQDTAAPHIGTHDGDAAIGARGQEGRPA